MTNNGGPTTRTVVCTPCATKEAAGEMDGANTTSTSQATREEGGESGTPQRKVDVPVRIGRTDARRHLTGGYALNVPNAPLRHGGDWHQYCTWFTREPQALPESAYTNERTHGQLLDRLGGSGLRDARRGLKRLSHPGGEATTKVWAATYDRAVLETAWKHLQEGTSDIIEGYKPIDTRELARWLRYPHQWLRLHALAWVLRNDLGGERLLKWDNWRHSWSPRG